MPLNNEQIKNLVSLVVDVEEDELDCDCCNEQLAEFAETHLLGKTLAQSQRAVEAHLKNCNCCEEEFQSLLAALKDAQDDCADE